MTGKGRPYTIIYRREGDLLEKLIGKVRAAVQRYDMIDEGDRVAVGVSGGKDSLFLLCALAELSR